MNKIIDGGSAFPRPAVFTQSDGLASVEQDGMSLRDYFAAHALQGLLASERNDSYAELVMKSYAFADEMIKAREKP